VLAADISRGRLLVLPRDIAHYGIDPEALDVAFAVRMRLSLPLFYAPVVLRDTTGRPCYIVDGGLLSSYPVWLFEEGATPPPRPVLGYTLFEPDEGRPNPITGPLSLLTALFSTMMGAHDARLRQKTAAVRTIAIPTLGVRTTEFELSPEKSQRLYEAGRQTAEAFFAHWEGPAGASRQRKKAPAKPVMRAVDPAVSQRQSGRTHDPRATPTKPAAQRGRPEA